MKLFIFKNELKYLEQILRDVPHPTEYSSYIQAVQKSIYGINNGNTFIMKNGTQKVELLLSTRQAYCVYQVLGYAMDNDPDKTGVIAYNLRTRMAECEELQPHHGLQLDGTYPCYSKKHPFK